MSREDLQKLLGGYATGTLTAEEQRLLFAAALEDQELFDALAREEALREVLSDPGSRAQLLAAIEEAPVPWYRRWGKVWSLAVPVAAMAGIVLVVGVTLWQGERAPEPARVAKVALPRVPIPLPAAPPSKPTLLPPAPEMRRAMATSPVASTLPGTAPMAAPAPPPPVRASAAPPQQAFGGNGTVGALTMQQASPQDKAQVGNGFVSANHLLQGAVTDGAGAAIPSATVQLRSEATGEVLTPRLDERGEFRVSTIPGTTYQVSAGAAGYQPASTTMVTPADGPPPAAHLRLESIAGAPAVAAASAGAVEMLHGVVTDGAGTAIPAAMLAVQSLDTGSEIRVSTDEKGQFSAPEAPGRYRITASKAGFQSKTVEVASADAVRLQMEAGPKAEAGRAGGAGGGSIVAVRIAPMMKAAKAAAGVLLDWKLLQKMPNGDLVDVPTDRPVPQGIALVLRVTPRADGWLRVEQVKGGTMANSQVKGGTAAEIPLPDFARGRVELRVSLSSQPAESKPQDQAAGVSITFNIR